MTKREIISAAVDLHTHSTFSDGSSTPAELSALALKAGLAGLAFTDHDTLDGLEAAREACGRQGLRFLAGLELSTHWRDLQNVHLLAYRVDGSANAPIIAACTRLRRTRVERAQLMVARLIQAGVELRFASVQEAAGGGAIGRPHVARALVADGWAEDITEAFELWLLPGKPGYVRHENIEAGAAAELLRNAGAAPVLAHPQTLGLAPEALDGMVADLVGHGLVGIEAYWSQQQETVVAHCEALAARHKLIATGGSDFHGTYKPNRLGDVAGGRSLGLDLMDQLNAAALGSASRAAGAR